MKPSQSSLQPEDQLLVDLLEKGRPMGDMRNKDRIFLSPSAQDVSQAIARYKTIGGEPGARNVRFKYLHAISHCLRKMFIEDGGRWVWNKTEGDKMIIEPSSADIKNMLSWRRETVGVRNALNKDGEGGVAQEDWFEALMRLAKERDANQLEERPLMPVDKFYDEEENGLPGPKYNRG